MVRPKIVLLIFVSGKIVLTGAKLREEIYQAFENIYPVLTGIYIYSLIWQNSGNHDFSISISK